jgi:microcin C transport system substrate-binding protein
MIKGNNYQKIKILTRLLIMVPVITGLLAGMSGCGFQTDHADRFPPEFFQERPDLRAQLWSEIGLTGSETEFDTVMTKLPEVVLDPPPEIGVNYYPEFPPDVPFNPDEWETNSPGPSIADPNAIRGGMLRYAISSYPPTIRTDGPNSSLSTLSDIHGLIYERLLGYDSTLGRYTPGLATHWQVGEDRRTFRYRLNPDARWADGRPITSDDVLATIEHLQNPDRQMPSTNQFWNNLVESVQIIDRLTVEIRVHEPRWRNMLSISAGLAIYPAAYIRMDGETYLNEWNWKLPPGSGPYELREDDIRLGRSITLRRRDNYWDEDNPSMRGVYNFDAIRMEVVRDAELIYQKFLAGELDVHIINTGQRWVEEVEQEYAVQMGWIQRRRIWNRSPSGYGGYCFNMRNPPFDNRNVRLAVTHLFNREELFSKYFFYQYEYMDSYFPGQDWARPDAEPVRFNPHEARRLLRAEGWERDRSGRLVRKDDGTPFPKLTFELAGDSSSALRIHNLFRDTLWREAGIEMELKQVDSASLSKRVWEHQFQLVYWFWTASLYPNPEFPFHSRFAHQTQSSNLAGIQIPEVDELVVDYQFEFDYDRRVEMLQRVDKLVFDEHPYALAWYTPSFRLMYWDKFGHPDEYASRFGSHLNNVIAFWWFDPEKAKRTEANQAARKPNYPGKELNQYDDVEQDWWMHNDFPMDWKPDDGEKQKDELPETAMETSEIDMHETDTDETTSFDEHAIGTEQSQYTTQNRRTS